MSRHADDDQYSSQNSRRIRKLYKNPDKAKVCGVCAGIAESFQLETWVVRLITVSFLLFSGGTAVVAYFVACFIMDPKPGSVSNKGCFGGERQRDSRSPSDSGSHLNSEHRQYRASVKDVWRKGHTPTETLQRVETTFDKMESKLQNLETYVTSNQYELEKEFQKMA